jgi:protease IV
MSQDPREQWERNTIEKLLLASLREQRLARRWNIFFRSLFWACFVLFLGVAAFHKHLPAMMDDTGGAIGGSDSHTAVVNLKGVLESEGEASAETIIRGLTEAFKDGGTRAVVLAVDTPGGSPVQAGQINDAIWKLKKQYPKVPLYAVVGEMCASGGYYVASAADKIYVDKASLVGSIGVVMGGFGFQGLMSKLGVERRTLTAGENKSFLDPFGPQSPSQKAYAQAMLNQIHQQFITVVKKGRGKRLHETPDLFSGLVWTGEQSVALGLADDFGSVQSVADDVVKESTLKDFSKKEEWMDHITQRLGVALQHVAWHAQVPHSAFSLY